MKIPDDKIRYVDLPDVSETFVDSIGLITFDGQSGRIELCITRMDAPKPPNVPTARRYPACRLVLPPLTMLNLYNQLKNIVDALERDGIIKKVQIDAKKAGPPS